MGVPQILVIIWCVFAFFWKMVLMAKHGESQGVGPAASIVAVLMQLLLTTIFQLLLLFGGFYG